MGEILNTFVVVVVVVGVVVVNGSTGISTDFCACCNLGFPDC